MIVKALGQLLLAVSLFHVAPLDAAVIPSAVRPDDSAFDAAYFLPQAHFRYLPKAEERITPLPKKIDLKSFGVATSADSVIVLDEASGVTLFAAKPDDVRPMGSITKLASVMVFLESEPTLSHRVFLDESDYVSGGRIYLRFHDTLTTEQLLGAILVGSDNVATQSLPRQMGITVEEFVDRMNAKVHELGLVSTHFADPTGLSAENVSTARELALLLERAKQYPVVEKLMKNHAYTITQASGFSVTISSTNELPGSLPEGYTVTAGKTGYIPQAGYCLATTVEHDHDGLVIVVLGAENIEDRFTDARALAVWAFRTFVWPTP